MTNAADIRRQFLDFFVERGHREVTSAPVCPQDDPTLLFTNAGMNQFKDVFLGTAKRDYTRAVDTQKCIRVSGKHNDLEEVGVDTYHHTFFEMLGNWSFGDYFKAEAIPWAWELLTEVWKLPKDRLWVTVFGGDEADGLPIDVDAERIWREQTDIPHDRILRFGKGDNFWEMGDTGPCGPCSEIHFDRGPADANRADGADRANGVNAGNERFIEIWNLVFMEFNRLDDGSLRPLPAKHVDTGMGFERITSILQKKHSNYDTDLFAPLFDTIAEVTGHRHGGTTSQQDVACRVIADHVRAVSSAVADGALPSNTGRGYVLRRLIRRAARYGRQALGVEEPFLHRLAPVVGSIFEGVFPEIPARRDHVALILKQEEESFGRTLGRGLARFEDLAGRVKGRVLPGAEVFDLYATYGFPKDLVELMARERGLEVDQEGWTKAESEHQAKSRSEGRFKQLLSAEELEGLPATRATYHDEAPACVATETTVEGLFRDAGAGERLVLATSPFYPEAGGQVGDCGVVEALDGTFRFRVRDARKVGAVAVLLGESEGETARGAQVVARVDAAARERTRKNHTATHLLHKALRIVLGDHVNQQGSYVGPDRLRFDLSHPTAITPEQVERIEEIVNENIVTNAPVATTLEDLDEAKARGVVALFGEKYDQRVRVVDVGGWSTELCGGTHVRAAGDIGPFVIVSESAIAAGVRRIEALTGPEAVRWMQRQRRLVDQVARALKTGADDVPARVEQLQKQVKDARKKQQASSQADVSSALETVRSKLVDAGGVRTAVVDLPELDVAALRELGGRAKALGPDLALVVFGREGERVPFLVLCEGGALERGLKAGDLAKEIGSILGGGGGGKPTAAQGQGLDPSAVGRAVEELSDRVAGALRA